jgi:hypothetical protein
MNILRYPALALALAACGPKTEAPVAPPEPPPAEATEAFTPSESQDQLYKMLSLRDAEVDCAALQSDTLLEDLVVIAEKAKMPPWAGVRAVHCLSSLHAEPSQEHLIRWLASEETAGFARAILDNIDVMPEPVALTVSQSALAGPSAEHARTALARSERASLRALVQNQPTEPETTP